MKAIVTGATGFAGKWLVDELLFQGDDITVIVRDKRRVPKEWGGMVHMVEAPLGQLRLLQAEDFAGKGGDIFFHFAWDGTSGDRRADISLQLHNVEFACDAVGLAKRLHCRRFVNAGSIMEYEAMQYISSDASRPGMGNIYSTAKLAADFMAKAMALQAGIEYISAVISNIYGPGERSARFLNATLRKMLKNEEVPLTHGEQLYDFIYASDAAKAIVLAAKKGMGNTSYYIGNARQRQLKEFIIQMKGAVGSKSQLLFGKVPFSGAMSVYQELDTEKLRMLGFAPEVGFGDGVKLTKEWILEEESEE